MSGQTYSPVLVWTLNAFIWFHWQFCHKAKQSSVNYFLFTQNRFERWKLTTISWKMMVKNDNAVADFFFLVAVRGITSACYVSNLRMKKMLLNYFKLGEPAVNLSSSTAMWWPQNDVRVPIMLKVQHTKIERCPS